MLPRPTRRWVQFGGRAGPEKPPLPHGRHEISPEEFRRLTRLAAGVTSLLAPMEPAIDRRCIDGNLPAQRVEGSVKLLRQQSCRPALRFH